jgi:DnaK suppressor protein
MDKARTLRYRELLQERLASFLRVSDTSRKQLVAATEQLADPADRTALNSSREILLAVMDRYRCEAREIMEALERLDQGKFGSCEECGDPIAEERLRVHPLATLCTECAAALEISRRAMACRTVEAEGF